MGQPLESALCSRVVDLADELYSPEYVTHSVGPEMRGINMFRVRDDRVVEQWAQLDMLGLLQQIGAKPTT